MAKNKDTVKTANEPSQEELAAKEAEEQAAKEAEEQAEKDRLEAEEQAAKEAEEQAEKDRLEAEEQAKRAASAKKPHYVAFFEQFVDLGRSGKTDQAIKAYNNCVKSAMAAKSTQPFSELLTMFKKSKLILDPKTILQSVSTLSAQDRATLEIVSVIYRALVFNPHTPINLEMVGSVTKSEDFVKWATKELAKAKSK